MDKNLFDHLVLSIKEAGAIKHDEILASRITALRLPAYKAVPEKMMKIIQACHLQDDLKLI